jgi:Fe-S-cluster containining protein
MQSRFCKNIVCRKCARCCSGFQSDAGFHPEDDLIIRKRLYEASGIIYLHPIPNKLCVSPEEAEMMVKEAKERNIQLKLLPNKLLYDEENNKLIILDYVLDHGICPFLDNKLCSIYEQRPKFCREFPKIKSNMKELNRKIKQYHLRITIPFEEAVEKAESLMP